MILLDPTKVHKILGHSKISDYYHIPDACDFGGDSSYYADMIQRCNSVDNGFTMINKHAFKLDNKDRYSFTRDIVIEKIYGRE